MIIESVSTTELTNRRQKLRRQRKIKSFQTIWRSLALMALTGGIVWVSTLPDWVIRKPEQIAIKGNRFLSGAAIRSLLSIPYPQSLLRIEPQAVAKNLESKAPIAQAIVTRQLLPPKLTIQVKERQPVAIAQLPQLVNSQISASNSQSGLLDEQGVWMPLKDYASLNRSHKLPTLKVVGYPQQYRSYWSELYQKVSQSPVKILEIDCSDPGNLILKTELGNVHFGAYTYRFSEQLSVLDRMRQLPNYIKTSEMGYINLTNPEIPSLQMLKASNTKETDTN